VTNCNIVGNSASSGGGACGGTLDHCTLAGNSAQGELTFDSGRYGDGGGAAGGTLNNCTLTGNSAVAGGGIAYSSLNNCILTGNFAYNRGGGAYYGILNNCTLVGNASGVWGGGMYHGTFNNCVIYYNTASFDGPNYYYDCSCDYRDFWGSLNFCCTTPMPYYGNGNITNAPLFVDAANGNFRLQPDSPCINAGNNSYISGSTGLDGYPRIAGDTVDIGAYEFQSPQSLLSYAWLQQYGLPTDGSADFADPDGDGHNNWQEWRAWTNPTDATSALRLLAPTKATNGVIVRWQSVSGQTYLLDRATDLTAQPAFASVASNILGQAGTTSFTDTNSDGSGPFFYRIRVK
jgi:hypothetical protein